MHNKQKDFLKQIQYADNKILAEYEAEFLKLSEFLITKDSRELSRALSSIHFNSKIKILDMSEMALTDHHVPMIVALLANNKSITSLNLKGNFIQNNALFLIGSLSASSALKNLDLSNNLLSGRNIDEKFINTVTSSGIEILNLRNNRLDEEERDNSYHDFKKGGVKILF